MGFNPKDAIKRVIEIKRQNQEKRAQEAALRRRNTRIEDMYKQTFTFGEVKIPFPNAFAYDMIERYFNGLDKADLHSNQDLGVMLYLINNQKDVSIADMSKDEIKQKGLEELVNIPQYAVFNYIVAIDEMFEVLKKKSSERAEQMNRLTKKFIAGQISASGLEKDLLNRKKNTTSK